MLQNQPLLESLRLKSKVDIKKAFCGEASDPNLNFENFYDFLKLKLGLQVSEKDAQKLFYQIDVYNKGLIQYRKLADYLEYYEERRSSKDEEIFHSNPSFYQGVRCQDSIFEWTVYEELKDSVDEIAGHYVSLSRSGLLAFWRRDFKKHFETTMAVLDDGDKMSTMATGLACLPKYKMIAVATTAADIRFFNANTYRFEHKFSIVWLPAVVVHMDCYNSEKMTCGDFSGCVYIINTCVSFFTRLKRRASHLGPQKIIFEDVRKGRITGLQVEATAKSHFTNVAKVKYIPALRICVSCSVHTKRSVMIHLLDRNESLSFSSEGGITCFDFCEKLNCLATGCIDNSVKVWNPLENTSCNVLDHSSCNGVVGKLVTEHSGQNYQVTPASIAMKSFLNQGIMRLDNYASCGFIKNLQGVKKTMTTLVEILTGHFNSVTHVLVDEKNLCVISADRNKTIRVWSLLRPLCLQILKIKEVDLSGKHIFASLYLDNEYGKLIITTYRVIVFTARSAVPRETAHPDSELVTYAAYNGVFDYFITVGNKASIAIWNAETHSLINEFTEAHFTSTKVGIPQAVGITAGGLDPTERRLVTADRNGIVKVWNFHLGICLKEFQAKFSVLALAVHGYEIFAAGSSGLISIFYDDGESIVEDTEWKPLHEQAVVSIDTYYRNMVASASCDGEIIVWLWKNEDAKFRMRDAVTGSDLSEESSDYPAKTLVEKRKDSSISEILFLKTREMDSSVGNLVSCGIDGRIRFWNVICTGKVNKGRLLSRFRAVFRKNDGVLCMETDKENKLLLAGDTMGYLRIYDLEDYYSTYGSVPTNAKVPQPHHYDKYPFLRLQQLIHSNHNQHSKFSSDGGVELGFAPLLLNCFRAHMGSILKVAFSNDRELVITAARGGSVRLWTLSGTYLGFLGSDGPRLTSDVKLKPKDIQATASTTTLHVLNGGKKPYWERAIEALKRCRLGHTSTLPEDRPFAWIKEKNIPPKEFSEEFTLHQELEKRLFRFPGQPAPKLHLHDMRRTDMTKK